MRCTVPHERGDGCQSCTPISRTGTYPLVNIFYPWQQIYFDGPDPEHIRPILSWAPVDWDYHNTKHVLHFSAGFMGCQQDHTDGTLTPVLGWYVTHDPPRDPMVRFRVIEKEILDLIKGHIDEAEAEAIDKNRPWFIRVAQLFYERSTIYRSLLKNNRAKTGTIGPREPVPR